MADGEPVSINHVVPEHYMEGLINNYLCQIVLLGSSVEI